MSNNTGLPPGWKLGQSCIATKHLEDFLYAEVRYEPDRQGWSHDYALYLISRDGPRHEERQGRFRDLGKAIQAGDRL